jgi:uncharacterized protein
VKDLVAAIARGLADARDAVEVLAEGDVYRLRLAQADLGKVIGKKGRTAKAFRVLVQAAAQKQGRNAQLEILEPERPAIAAGDSAPIPDSSDDE